MINSNTLIATAADSRNDVITTGAVLVAAILSHFVGFELDGWMGLGVAVFILYSGFGLVKTRLTLCSEKHRRTNRLKKFVKRF